MWSKAERRRSEFQDKCDIPKIVTDSNHSAVNAVGDADAAGGAGAFTNSAQVHPHTPAAPAHCRTKGHTDVCSYIL